MKLFSILDYLKLENTHEDHQVQFPLTELPKNRLCDQEHHSDAPWTLSGFMMYLLLWRNCSNAQHPLVRKLFLMSSLNFPQCSFISFAQRLPLVTRERRSAPFPHICLWESCRLLWALPSAVSSLSWTSQGTLAKHCKSCPQGLSPFWSPCSVHTLITLYPSCIVMPKLHTLLKVRLHQHRGEQDSRLPRQTGDNFLDVSQGPWAARTHGWHIQIAIDLYLQISFSRNHFYWSILARISYYLANQCYDNCINLGQQTDLKISMLYLNIYLSHDVPVKMLRVSSSESTYCSLIILGRSPVRSPELTLLQKQVSVG